MIFGKDSFSFFLDFNFLSFGWLLKLLWSLVAFGQWFLLICISPIQCHCFYHTHNSLYFWFYVPLILQVGYIVTSCLLNENYDFLRMAINTVRNDIIGRNETFQCLALTMVLLYHGFLLQFLIVKLHLRLVVTCVVVGDCFFVTFNIMNPASVCLLFKISC